MAASSCSSSLSSLAQHVEVVDEYNAEDTSLVASRSVKTHQEVPHLVNTTRAFNASFLLPVVHRKIAHAVDPDIPIETLRSSGNRTVGIMIAKANVGEAWKRLFMGDPEGARCCDPPPQVTMAQVKKAEAVLLVPQDSCREEQAKIAKAIGGCAATYVLKQLETEVVIELQVPFWVTKKDVSVSISHTAVRVRIDDYLDMHRTFWGVTPPCAEAEGEEGNDQNYGSYQAVLPELCTWTLEEVTDHGAAVSNNVLSCHQSSNSDEVQVAAGSTAGHVPAFHSNTSKGIKPLSLTGNSCPLAPATAKHVEHTKPSHSSVTARRRQPKILTLYLTLPDCTEEETMYKKGVRQNHRTAVRLNSGEKGWSFFVEDEDEFGLEDMLQAMVFRNLGGAFIAPKPWKCERKESAHPCASFSNEGSFVYDQRLLPRETLQALVAMNPH
ncbi:hypothetical protein CEUSTIGMA_g3884.t1 [Chlamydomonas eustigma]|uniref:Uncharacterized protein n=1 Tax=Chlamydomonas eustigma TaxID=1157962 RepID=A0A250X0G6_9CHLO|nr:hypothetical protein CEUSTIGMA_g3884.t1 [Chlamydomonas eustigma]|eukprot:GAX76439.1 hypothetical protein CEUSTIGMA_g3884.t1 [Chlamydomonas eustigma]